MKKRLLSMVCVLVLLASVMLPLAAMAGSTSQARYVYTSNGKSLNLRSAPVSHSNNKIANIPYGAKVVVKDYVNNGTWAYVNYNGYYGYVMSRYLVASKPAEHKHTSSGSSTKSSNTGSYTGFTAISYEALVRAHTPGGYVNLRWGPSKQAAVQEKIGDSTHVRVIAQNNTWAQVQDPATGAVGFMMRAFLTVVDSTGSEGAATPTEG